MLSSTPSGSSNSSNTVTIPRRGRKPRVDWSAEELAQVIESSANLMEFYPDLMKGARHEGYARAIAIVQERTMDESRHLKPSSITNLLARDNRRVRSAIANRRLEIIRQRSNGDIQEVPRIRAKVSVEAPAAKEAGFQEVTLENLAVTATTEATSIAEVMKEVEVRAAALEATLAKLTGSIAANFRAQLAKALTLEVEQAVDAASSAASFRIRNSEMKDKMKVLVIGPHPREQKEIERQVGNLMDLKFVSAADAPKQVLNKSPGVDYTVYHDSVSKDHIQRIRTVNDPIKVIGSGTTTMVEALENLYAMVTSK